MASKGERSRKPRQLKSPPEGFIERLAAGESHSHIADEIGCSRNVVARWAQLPEVKLALSDRAAELKAAALQRMTSLINGALDTLEEVMLNPEQPGSPRVRAAEAILDRAGLPSTSAVELSGGLTLGAIPVAAQERVVVEEAVDILRSWGLHEAADVVAQALSELAP